jgi:hypothetical protein
MYLALVNDLTAWRHAFDMIPKTLGIQIWFNLDRIVWAFLHTQVMPEVLQAFMGYVMSPVEMGMNVVDFMETVGFLDGMAMGMDMDMGMGMGMGMGMDMGMGMGMDMGIGGIGEEFKLTEGMKNSWVNAAEAEMLTEQELTTRLWQRVWEEAQQNPGAMGQEVVGSQGEVVENVAEKEVPKANLLDSGATSAEDFGLLDGMLLDRDFYSRNLSVDDRQPLSILDRAHESLWPL